MLHVPLAFLFSISMRTAPCIAKRSTARAVHSRAYWTGISVLPENWLSSAGTGVELTDKQNQCPMLPHQLPLIVQQISPAQFSVAVLWCSHHTHHRAVWGVSFKSLALMKIKPEDSNLSDNGTEPWSVWKEVQLDLDDCPFLYECFMSRFTILCLVGRPWHPEPLRKYCYILMQSILLLCFAFMHISAFLPWQGCKHVSHSSPVSLLTFSLALFFQSFWAVKGQTETGVHCEVIPVQCLLCLCNWCHPAVPIISDRECVQCSFPPILENNSEPPRQSTSSWRFHTNRKVEVH